MPEEIRELAEMLHNTCVTETGVDEGMLFIYYFYLLKLIRHNVEYGHKLIFFA